MAPDPDTDHTFATRFRIPRRMWDTYGRVLGTTDRTADLLDHIRTVINTRGDQHDLAELNAAEQELAERRSRKGGRPPKERTRSTAAEALARGVAAADGQWDTTRAVTTLRDTGIEVGAGDRADEKQARSALRELEAEGLLVRVDSAGNTAAYRRAEVGK